MFFMVAASFFIVCGVSAASQVQFSLAPDETMVVYLDNEYTFTVPDDSAGDYGFFNWTVSETPIGHTGLIQSSVVNYAGASMPNITVSAQRDSTYSGNVTFMFDSAVGSGAKVRIYLSVAVTLQNQTDNTISGYMNLNLSAWNYNGNAIPNMGSANDKLNQILDALGSSYGPLNFDMYNPLFYLSKNYFSALYTSVGNVSFNDDGFAILDNCDGVVFYSSNPDRLVSGFLQPGNYFLVVSGKSPVSGFVLDSYNSDYYTASFSSSPNTNGIYISIVDIAVKQPFGFHNLEIRFPSAFSGPIYGALIPYSADQSASAAINPDQSGLVSDVDNAGQQQHQQEDQLWTNINSYKGDLTFNIDDWSDAAGGLSYVSGIFMSIWNNSPTQIIILSLMLGIAMLSIGRGVQAAVRVSRHRDDD